MSGLAFKPVSLDDMALLTPFFEKYGEGSCQHSFPSLFLFCEKYGSCWTIESGFLLIHRSNRDIPGYRVYMQPFGEGDFRAAVLLLLEDARAHGAVALFENATSSFRTLTDEFFPGRFSVTENRDYAEYVYLSENLFLFPGSVYRGKRNEVSRFLRDNASSLRVSPILPEDCVRLCAFHEAWLAQYSSSKDAVCLEHDFRMSKLALENFAALDLTGLVFEVSDHIAGYAFGYSLGSTFDLIGWKGDYRYKYVYSYMLREIAAHVSDRAFFNIEEDVGSDGLRNYKLSLHPDHLLEKFTLKEVV